MFYTAKMCHNSATWYSGAFMRTNLQLVGHKMIAMATPVA